MKTNTETGETDLDCGTRVYGIGRDSIGLVVSPSHCYQRIDISEEEVKQILKEMNRRKGADKDQTQIY